LTRAAPDAETGSVRGFEELRMRFGRFATGLLAAGLLVSGARAECLLPEPAPTLPNGATATEAEMRAGHDALQGFVDKLQTYQACLEDEIKNAPADTRPEMKIAWRTVGNAAIDQARDLAAEYDNQIKLYKSRHPGK
jgi:hypothetical protein